MQKMERKRSDSVLLQKPLYPQKKKQKASMKINGNMLFNLYVTFSMATTHRTTESNPLQDTSYQR